MSTQGNKAMLTTLIDNLGFAEGLRWHEGKLWFADFITRKVQSFTFDGDEGKLAREAFVLGQPSGLGFMPDGSALVVSMMDKKLLRFEAEQLHFVADLAPLSRYPCNDMLVDQNGHAYIGTFSHDVWYAPAPTTPPTCSLLHVTPNGKVSIAASGLKMPNGIVRLPNRNIMVVAETGANRLVAFDVKPDGSLDRQRVFADLGSIQPDGICVNAEGDIWVAGLYANEFLLVREGGHILQRISTPGRWAVTCALGGNDGHSLFCATTKVNQANDMGQGRCTSAIECIDVAVPAACHRV
jgi:sugar lactone lactonase YvrE